MTASPLKDWQSFLETKITGLFSRLILWNKQKNIAGQWLMP
jgi:hypothetical protein